MCRFLLRLQRHSRTWERNKKVCLFIANQERGKMFWCVVCNRGSKKYRCRAKAILRYHASQTLHYLHGISVCNAGYGGLMILVEIRRTLFLHWVVSDHDWKHILHAVRPWSQSNQERLAPAMYPTRALRLRFIFSQKENNWKKIWIGFLAISTNRYSICSF